MTTQTLIFILAGLLTTSSVVSAIVFRTNFKAIEADLQQARSSLDSAHVRIAQMRQMINDDLLPRVEGEIEELNAFSRNLDELSSASMERMREIDSVRQAQGDSLQSLFDKLNN